MDTQPKEDSARPADDAAASSGPAAELDGEDSTPQIIPGRKRKYALFMGYLGAGYHVSPGGTYQGCMAANVLPHTPLPPLPPFWIAAAGHAAQPAAPHHRI
jgi:hypothetical protein